MLYKGESQVFFAKQSLNNSTNRRFFFLNQVLQFRKEQCPSYELCSATKLSSSLEPHDTVTETSSLYENTSRKNYHRTKQGNKKNETFNLMEELNPGDSKHKERVNTDNGLTKNVEGMSDKRTKDTEYGNEMSFDTNEDEADTSNLIPTSTQKDKRSLEFMILGDPVPLRRHRVARGMMYNPSGKDQKQFLNQSMEYMPDTPLIGPIEAVLTFKMKRPKAHYRGGKFSHILKADAPRYHTRRIDIDNLIKMVLDSLNGYAYHDDKQVVAIRACKEYADVDGEESTHVLFRELGDTNYEKEWNGIEEKKLKKEKRIPDEQETKLVEDDTSETFT